MAASSAAARGGVRRLALNTAAPMAARLVDAGFALVYLRLLGRLDVGAYQVLVVVTTYLDTLVDFGLNALVARDVARGHASPESAFRSVNLLRLGLWLVGLPIVALVYGPLRGIENLSDDAALAGGVFYLALLPTVLAKTASGVLWAAERLDLTATVQVIATLLRTALGAIVLFAGFGLIGLAASSLVTNLVTALILWWLSRQASSAIWLTGLTRSTHLQGEPSTDPTGGGPSSPSRPPSVGALPATPARSPGAWLRESWPLFLNQLLQGLFFKIDAVLLLPIAGASAAGAYAAAYKVAEGAGIISSSFTLALFPRLSRHQDLPSAYRLALRILLQVAFPLAAGVALLSEPIIGLVGGREYLPDAAVALAILIAYLPLSYANGLTQYVLIAAGKQRLLTGAFAAALVFNLAANLLLIPRYGYVGAAIVTVASEVILLVPFQWAARRVSHGVSVAREVRPPILATVLMAPVVWWLRDAIHPIAAIVAGGAIYFVALWSLGGIDARQVELFRQLLPRPRPS